MGLMDPTERVWRCRKCGKWSHAQRKPSRHRRLFSDGPPDDHNGYEGTPARRVALASGYRADDIVEEIGGGYMQTAVDDDRWDPGYVMVVCGPFEEWQATRVA